MYTDNMRKGSSRKNLIPTYHNNIKRHFWGTSGYLKANLTMTFIDVSFKNSLQIKA